MGNSSGRSTREAKQQQQRDTALKLRIGRLSYQAIADAMSSVPGASHVSKTYAFKLVRAALDDLREHTRETANELRSIDAEAIDRMQTALWKRCLDGDQEAIRVTLELLRQRAKLFGYEAPEKKEIHVGGVSLDDVTAARTAAEKNG